MNLDVSLFTDEVIWFLLGVGLLLLELIIPGLILLFFGIGAWVTAAVLLAFDLSFNAQLIIFIITSLGSLALLRQNIRKRYMDVSIESFSNSENAYIGSKAVSLTAISPEKDGKVELNGSQWDACSNSVIAPRVAVRIIGMKSIKLIVEPLNQNK